MKKQNIGYALSPRQTVIEFDESQFVKAINVTKSPTPIAYEQIFVWNDIVEYTTIVMTGTSETFKRRVGEIGDLYGLKPAIVQNNNTECLYRLSKRVSKPMFKRIAQTMERLLQGEHKVYRTYGLADEYETTEHKSIDIAKVIAISEWIKDKDTLTISDVRNDTLLPIVVTYDVHEVVNKIDITQAVDDFIGIVIGYGSTFTYVMKKFGNIELVYRFFNEHFNTGFNCSMYSVDQYVNEWVSIQRTGIIESGGWYVTLTDEGKAIPMTDFHIRVHYKLMRANGDIAYIVSFIGSDREVKHLEWLLSYSPQKLAEYVNRNGNFHINPTAKTVNTLHEMISGASVPEIHAYNKYGRAEYEGRDIIIYGDYVYDTTHKKAYARTEGTNFYFFDNVNGIMVESRNNKSMASVIGEDVVKLGNIHQTVTYKDLYNVTSAIYADASAHMILLYALSMTAYAAFKPINENPVYFVTGVTGTGKSTFSSILMSIFGVKKPVNIETTTVLPLLMDLVAYDSLPVFYTEFRTRMNYATEKTGIIKAVFDQWVFSRGKRDMSVDRYVFSSTVFIEWEELPKSGATRTRSIIHTTKHKGRRAEVNTLFIKKLMKNQGHILSSLQYSFLDLVSEELYLEKYQEGQERYMKRWDVEPRILANIALLYAAWASFAPDYEEDIAKCLDELLSGQVKDFQENGTSAEIVKQITKYVGYKFAKIYIKHFDIIFQWSDIEEYITKNRLELELSVDTYKLHLEASWFEVGYFEVYDSDEIDKEEILVHWIKINIGKCPKDFFYNKDIYKLFKKYEAYKVPWAVR